ncbi:MAG TPA: DUF6760 family protein [Pyrinomonadaceae bacterium]|nr:DUF6760 family protein [Pyrinomonadaceae bacterium]
MPELRARVRRGGQRPGGSLTGYPLERLYEEMAFIAYHFHWSQEELMNAEHRERRRWCEEISRINKKLSDEPDNIFDV